MKHKFLLLKQKLVKLMTFDSGLRWTTVFSTVFIMLALSFVSCEVDDFTEEVPSGENNQAPTVQVISPVNQAILKSFEENVFEANFEDMDIGLSQVTVSIINSETNDEFVSAKFTLIGTSDDVTWEIPADSLLAGEYTVSFLVSDTQGKSTSVSRAITVRDEFSNYPQMNMAGSFNGWSNSATSMALEDDYLWATMDSVELSAGDEFLFIADPSFDPKFGDGDCDMIAELGGNNTACNYSGTFRVYFNDQTLEYELRGTVVLASIQDEMFVLGSMNGWGGTDLQMTLVDDFTWQVEDVAIGSGDEFKFANTSNFSGEDWGDGNCDNQAEEFGSNIACGYNGTFVITFNDQTLTYTVE